MREHRAAIDRHVGYLDRTCFGLRDIKAAPVGPAKSHVGAENPATEVHAQRRLPSAIEEPYGTQQWVRDCKAASAVHCDAVGPSAPAQLDEVQYARQASVGKHRNLDDAVRPSQSDVEH